MNFKLPIVSALALVLLIACFPPKDDPVKAHPTPIPVDTDMCDAAEAHLLALGCPEGQPTKRGLRFGDVCRELQNVGIFANPRCLANVKSCAEIDVCTGTSQFVGH